MFEGERRLCGLNMGFAQNLCPNNCRWRKCDSPGEFVISMVTFRNTPSFAPLPSQVRHRSIYKIVNFDFAQISWENIRSRRSYYLGGFLFNILLIFFVVICSTPGVPTISL